MRYVLIIFTLLICGCTAGESMSKSEAESFDSCIGGSCIEDAFDSCKSIEETFSFHQDIPLEVRTKIVSKEGDSCIIEQEVIKDETGMGYEGKTMTCTIPENYDIEEMQDYCEGELLDSIMGVRR